MFRTAAAQKIGNVVMSGDLGQPPLIDTWECGLTPAKLNDVTPSWRRCRGSAARQGCAPCGLGRAYFFAGRNHRVNEMTLAIEVRHNKADESRLARRHCRSDLTAREVLRVGQQN